MSWVWRFAVGVTLLVFLEFALSSHSQLTDLKRNESVQLANQDMVRSQYRQKRLLATIAGVFSTLFKVGKFIYGEVNAQKQADKQQMQQGLLGVERRLVSKFNQLDDSIADLRNDHRWLEGVIIYAQDIQRLKYILHTLNLFSLDDDTASLQPATEVQHWAEGILSMNGRSIGQVLYSMHDMVMGNTALFGNTPIVTLVNDTLDPTASDYSVKLKNLANVLFNLQMSGYFAWATAMNVMNRSSGISQIQESVQQRFQEQEQSLIISLMAAWPSGQYGLPLRKLHDICPSPHIAWRFGNMTWFNGYNHDILEFCMRAETGQLSEEYRGEGDWPAGTYCIYQQGPSCPAGFDSSSLSYKAWDGRQKKYGSLPRSSYTDINTISYCCRSDGSPHIPIRLPPIVRFSLPRCGNHCQEVHNMRIKPGRLYWYRYNFSPVYSPNASESRPSIVQGHLWVLVPICYYEPAFWK